MEYREYLSGYWIIYNKETGLINIENSDGTEIKFNEEDTTKLLKFCNHITEPKFTMRFRM